ncbi:MAG: hypothetical protein WAN93_03190 [Solirubrobacteraceae bacterium]
MNQRSRISALHIASNLERDRLQATIGAWLTVVLVVTVDFLWVMARLLTGKGQLSAINLLVFTLGGLVIVGWLGLRAASDKVDTLMLLLARVTRIGAAEGDIDALDARVEIPGRFRSLVANLWIPVTLQFILVGWLIYASGGLTNSPYGPVLVVMMAIGQSVYHAPAIELGAEVKMRDVLIFIGRVTRLYVYPQLMFVCLLIALVLLQEHHPLVTRPTPPGEMIFTLQLCIFVSMCVVFITRRADRAMAPGAN